MINKMDTVTWAEVGLNPATIKFFLFFEILNIIQSEVSSDDWFIWMSYLWVSVRKRGCESWPDEIENSWKILLNIIGDEDWFLFGIKPLIKLTWFLTIKQMFQDWYLIEKHKTFFESNVMQDNFGNE